MGETLNTTELVDICSIRVDSNLSKQERIIEYVRQINNPYHYNCLDWEITAIYAEDGPEIEDCLERIMK